MTKLVLTGWSAISPYGRGREAFLGRRATGHDVPDFSAREALGSKGTRSMTRLTALAIATVGDLIADTGCDTGADTGLVLGTTTGSAQSMMDFTRSSLTAARPHRVDPALFPNTVMNCAAGQCAIWHGLRGPNVTIAGGRTAGLMALSYTGRLIRSHRAKRVLVGAAEECSPARARLIDLARPPHEIPKPLTEGCAATLAESVDHDAPGRAEILAVRSRLCLDGSPGAALRDCVDAALVSASCAGNRIWAVSGTGTTQERELLAGRPTWIDGLPGDASSASATFQLVSVLAAAELNPSHVDRFALVTAVDTDGSSACVVLRLIGSPR
ncbi:beta-ketoacyl synthase N-terminal-like domain-containing protein [Kutzneria buriramensis]|uniref:3-oxoacyl-[acyl-carrier-protein] synthase II n=1 Tax=Kutzneria buriramensis TaxID=1045776 RepID=A0A3E0GTE5_9PSEU|nr:beta-ketoacyl synthase N-terminal-like domain-containing protein [Kutzneria buriramensis]REH26993.1 3-oxoacyl-[acyl-carrier-protein] synthase II [Kutzneria buriramensis]